MEINCGSRFDDFNYKIRRQHKTEEDDDDMTTFCSRKKNNEIISRN